ncbi:MAG: phosphoenolpyruvate carboxylase [Planctomycetota bacterium]
MTIANPISPDHDALRDDVRMLGHELGAVLRDLGEPGLYEQVETVRAVALARREGDPQAEARLRDLIANLSLTQARDLIRALSCFFDLANLAEDRHRVRVLRQRERDRHPDPRRESVGDALKQLRDAGRTAAEVDALLNRVDVDLVFTAHPTEAKRRTVRATLRRLRNDLIDLESDDLLPRERDRLLHRIRTDLACLWETDSLRPAKPTVLEEVDRSLFVADTLWAVVPDLAAAARAALRRVYPEDRFAAQPSLRFGSWIGGDRDGNPFVTADVTRQTLLHLRRAAVDRHLRDCAELLSTLTLSSAYHAVSPALDAAIAAGRDAFPDLAAYLDTTHPAERYRHFLRIVRHRLRATRDADPFADLPSAAYPHGQALLDDIQLIADSLSKNDHADLAGQTVRAWIDRAAVFGLHFARLDIREDSAQLHDTLAALALFPSNPEAAVYASADEAARQRLLALPINPAAARAIDPASLTDRCAETLALFELIHTAIDRLGPDAFGIFIVSMTHHPSDVLAVHCLSRIAAARLQTPNPQAGAERSAAPGTDSNTTPPPTTFCPLPTAPLFETLDDLANAPHTLAALLDQPDYAAALHHHGNRQHVMVGYSDSTKDGGYLAANVALHDAQQRLADLADARRIELVFFHGRGGSLGRGGGPAARGILSLPPASVGGSIRITEQGEVLAERYDDPEIARRHLEQVSYATLLVTGRAAADTPAEWHDFAHRAADAAKFAYRRLITDPAFIEFFSQATPIDTIEDLPIGSRPSRRRAAERQLSGLRAIPYTFAWTQNRSLITGFFGMGHGLVAAASGTAAQGAVPDVDACDFSLCRTMYRDWPFFRAMIDNAELALAKADLPITKRYAELTDDPTVGQCVLRLLIEEHRTARAAVLAITQRDELLADTPWLARSIQVRNRYVDPLNYLQAELMQRRRAESDPDAQKQIDHLLRMTVQGIAAGLRTTG